MTLCKFKNEWYFEFLTLFSTAEGKKLFLLFVCFVVGGVVVLICFMCLQFYFIILLMYRYQVMLNCWQEDADDRPTFEGLRRELKRMENQHKVN